jgi:HAD superfamily phosphoserine phosphatase-like hydrolase
VYLVSASAENWLAAWCQQLNIQLIATQLEINNGLVTGKILGHNCYGPEKVNRINAKIILHDYQQIHCYGDSSGDREMLALAHFPNYRLF